MKLEKIDHYLNYLTKDELAKLLKLDEKSAKKFQKEELIKSYQANFGKSKKITLELIKTFPKTFQVHPSTLEEELGISKTERKRWTEERKLSVAGYETFTKWGKTMEYPLYNLYELFKLSDKK